jgi:hypothetical protein
VSLTCQGSLTLCISARLYFPILPPALHSAAALSFLSVLIFFASSPLPFLSCSVRTPRICEVYSYGLVLPRLELKWLFFLDLSMVDRLLHDDLRTICLHWKAPRFNLHRQFQSLSLSTYLNIYLSTYLSIYLSTSLAFTSRAV